MHAGVEVPVRLRNPSPTVVAAPTTFQWVPTKQSRYSNIGFQYLLCSDTYIGHSLSGPLLAQLVPT